MVKKTQTNTYLKNMPPAADVHSAQPRYTSHVSTNRVANIVHPKTGAHTIRQKVENDIESNVLGGS